MASQPPAVPGDLERSLEDVRRRIALLQAQAQHAPANQAPHPPSLSSQHSPPGPPSVWMPHSSPLLQPPSPLASSAPSSPAWQARSAAESPTSSHEGFRFEGYTHTFDYADSQLSPSRASLNAPSEQSRHPREGWQDNFSSWNPAYASGLAPPPIYPTSTFSYPAPGSLHSYQHSGWPETIEEASNEGSEVGDRSGRPSREGYFDERHSLEEASSSTLREEEEILEGSSNLFVTADQAMATGSNTSPLVALADTPSPGSNGIHPGSVPQTPGRTTSLPEWPTTLDSGQSHRRSQSNEYTASSVHSSPCRSLAVTDTPSDWATAGTTVRASDDREPLSDSQGSDNSSPVSRLPPLQPASTRPDLSRPLTGATARSGSSESLSPSVVLPSSIFNPPAKSNADVRRTSSFAIESPESEEGSNLSNSPRVSTLRAGKDLITRKLRSPRRSTRKLQRSSSTTEDEGLASELNSDSTARIQAARSSMDHRCSSGSPPVILPGQIRSPDSAGPSDGPSSSSPRPSPPIRRKSWHKRIAPHLARKLALRNEVLAGPIPGPLDPSWVQEDLEYDEDQLARRRALEETREGSVSAPRPVSPPRHAAQGSGASSIEAVLALEERLKQGEEFPDPALGLAAPGATATDGSRQPASSLGLEGVAQLRAFPSLSDVVGDSPSNTTSPRGSLSLRRKPNFTKIASREHRADTSQNSNAGGSLAAVFTLGPLPANDQTFNDQEARLSVTPTGPYTRSSSTSSTVGEDPESSKSLAPPKPLIRQRSFSHDSIIGRPSISKQAVLDSTDSQTSFFDAQSNYSDSNDAASLDVDLSTLARSTAMCLSNSLPNRASAFADLDKETIASLLRTRAQSATDVTTTSALQPTIAAEAPSSSSNWLRSLTAGKITSNRPASGSYDSPIEYQYRPSVKHRPTSVVLGPFDLQVPDLPADVAGSKTQRRQSLPSSFDGKVAALFNGTSSSRGRSTSDTSLDSRLSIRRNVAARRHRRRQVQSIDLAIGLGIPVQLSTAAGLGWHETIEESPDLGKLTIRSLNDSEGESPDSAFATLSDRMMSTSITHDTETSETTLEERRKSAARQRSMDLLMGTHQALSSPTVPFGAAALAAAGRRSRTGLSAPGYSSQSDSSHQSSSSRHGRNATRSTIFLAPDDFNRHSDRQQQQQQGPGGVDDQKRSSLLWAIRLSSASSSLSAANLNAISQAMLSADVPSYISARSANSIISESRPTRIQAETLSFLNRILDELLLFIVASARSLATDRLKTDGLLKVMNNNVLAKDAVLEAELELRNYLLSKKAEGGRVPLGLSATSRWDGTEAFPVASAYAALRTRCQYYSTLGDREDDSVAGDQNILSHEGKTVATITPAVSIYVTALLEFVGEYILQSVTRVVERDNSDEASLIDLKAAVEEDESLITLWRQMVVKREISSRADALAAQHGVGKVTRPWKVPEANEQDQAAKPTRLRQKRASVQPVVRPGTAGSTGWMSIDRSGAESSQGHDDPEASIDSHPGGGSTEATINRLKGNFSATQSPVNSSIIERPPVLTRKSSFDRGLSGLFNSRRRGSIRASQDVGSTLLKGSRQASGSFGEDGRGLSTSESLDDFEALMMSDQTMKVSLTPNRLRGIEVARQEAEERKARLRPGTLTIGNGSTSEAPGSASSTSNASGTMSRKQAIGRPSGPPPSSYRGPDRANSPLPRSPIELGETTVTEEDARGTPSRSDVKDKRTSVSIQDIVSGPTFGPASPSLRRTQQATERASQSSPVGSQHSTNDNVKPGKSNRMKALVGKPLESGSNSPVLSNVGDSRPSTAATDTATSGHPAEEKESRDLPPIPPSPDLPKKIVPPKKQSSASKNEPAVPVKASKSATSTPVISRSSTPTPEGSNAKKEDRQHRDKPLPGQRSDRPRTAEKADKPLPLKIETQEATVDESALRPARPSSRLAYISSVSATHRRGESRDSVVTRTANASYESNGHASAGMYGSLQQQQQDRDDALRVARSPTPLDDHRDTGPPSRKIPYGRRLSRDDLRSPQERKRSSMILDADGAGHGMRSSSVDHSNTAVGSLNGVTLNRSLSASNRHSPVIQRRASMQLVVNNLSASAVKTASPAKTVQLLAYLDSQMKLCSSVDECRALVSEALKAALREAENSSGSAQENGKDGTVSNASSPGDGMSETSIKANGGEAGSIGQGFKKDKAAWTSASRGPAKRESTLIRKMPVLSMADDFDVSTQVGTKAYHENGLVAGWLLEETPTFTMAATPKRADRTVYIAEDRSIPSQVQPSDVTLTPTAIVSVPYTSSSDSSPSQPSLKSSGSGERKIRKLASMADTIYASADEGVGLDDDGSEYAATHRSSATTATSTSPPSLHRGSLRSSSVDSKDQLPGVALSRDQPARPRHGSLDDRDRTPLAPRSQPSPSPRTPTRKKVPLYGHGAITPSSEFTPPPALIKRMAGSSSSSSPPREVMMIPSSKQSLPPPRKAPTRRPPPSAAQAAIRTHSAGQASFPK